MTRIVFDTNEVSAKVIASVVRTAGYGRIANEIESQLPIARIPEPDPGERVTACVAVAGVSGNPETFLRLRLQKLRNEEPYEWACLATGHVYKWRVLIDPVLIRDGVTL